MMDTELDVRMSDGSCQEDRPYSIWLSRIHREYDIGRLLAALPAGVTLQRVHMDDQGGACKGEFHCFAPFRQGSEALTLIPLIALAVSTPFHRNQLQGSASESTANHYPFVAPDIEITCGAMYLPQELVATVHEEGQERQQLQLPILAKWNPANTIPMVLHQLVQWIQENDPQPPASATAKASASSSVSMRREKPATSKPARAGASMRMRRRDIHGNIYECREMLATTGELIYTPLLLQNGKLVLLHPEEKMQMIRGSSSSSSRSSSSSPAAEGYVHVRDVIALRDVARITPQRMKSITLFVKSPDVHCRTLLTFHTEEIVHDLRRMVSSSSGSHGGTKRGREETNSQLLSFLTPEQSDKAKEFSNKLMGKIGKYASSVSRFFRGEDDVNPPSQRSRVDLHAAAFDEIEDLKRAFFRTPSKAKMLEITQRYQRIAEKHAQNQSTDGHVEQAVAQLQEFIEHAAVQKILLEDCAYAQHNKGIRVGPVHPTWQSAS